MHLPTRHRQVLAPIAHLLAFAVLTHGAAAAIAADRATAKRAGADADRQAFLTYKLRETGQAGAKAAAGGLPDRQAQPPAEADRPSQERKPMRTVAYGNTFGRGPGASPGN